MELSELNKLIKLSNLTKKELAELMNTSSSTVNGWGISGKKIPAWVESWLKNYIDLQDLKGFKKSYIKCSEELRVANNKLYELEEDINESEDMTARDIIEAEKTQKLKKIFGIKQSDIINEDSLKTFMSGILDRLEKLEKENK